MEHAAPMGRVLIDGCRSWPIQHRVTQVAPARPRPGRSVTMAILLGP